MDPDEELDVLVDELLRERPQDKEAIMELINTFEGDDEELIEVLRERYGGKAAGPAAPADATDDAAAARAALRINGFLQYYGISDIGRSDRELLIDQLTTAPDKLEPCMSGLCARYSKPAALWTGPSAGHPFILQQFFEARSVPTDLDTVLKAVSDGVVPYPQILQRLCAKHGADVDDWSGVAPRVLLPRAFAFGPPDADPRAASASAAGGDAPSEFQTSPPSEVPEDAAKAVGDLAVPGASPGLESEFVALSPDSSVGNAPFASTHEPVVPPQLAVAPAAPAAAACAEEEIETVVQTILKAAPERRAEVLEVLDTFDGSDEDLLDVLYEEYMEPLGLIPGPQAAGAAAVPAPPVVDADAAAKQRAAAAVAAAFAAGEEDHDDEEEVEVVEEVEEDDVSEDDDAAVRAPERECVERPVAAAAATDPADAAVDAPASPEDRTADTPAGEDESGGRVAIEENEAPAESTPQPEPITVSPTTAAAGPHSPPEPPGSEVPITPTPPVATAPVSIPVPDAPASAHVREEATAGDGRSVDSDDASAAEEVEEIEEVEEEDDQGNDAAGATAAAAPAPASPPRPHTGGDDTTDDDDSSAGGGGDESPAREVASSASPSPAPSPDAGQTEYTEHTALSPEPGWGVSHTEADADADAAETAETATATASPETGAPSPEPATPPAVVGADDDDDNGEQQASTPPAEATPRSPPVDDPRGDADADAADDDEGAWDEEVEEEEEDGGDDEGAAPAAASHAGAPEDAGVVVQGAHAEVAAPPPPVTAAATEDSDGGGSARKHSPPRSPSRGHSGSRSLSPSHEVESAAATAAAREFVEERVAERVAAEAAARERAAAELIQLQMTQQVAAEGVARQAMEKDEAFEYRDTQQAFKTTLAAAALLQQRLAHHAAEEASVRDDTVREECRAFTELQRERDFEVRDMDVRRREREAAAAAPAANAAPEPTEHVSVAQQLEQASPPPPPQQCVTETTPPRAVTFVHPAAPSTVAGRVAAMLQHYSPEKAKNAPALLQKYAGREDQLLDALVHKFGPEPGSEAATMAATSPPPEPAAPSMSPAARSSTAGGAEVSEATASPEPEPVPSLPQQPALPVPSVRPRDGVAAAEATQPPAWTEQESSVERKFRRDSADGGSSAASSSSSSSSSPARKNADAAVFAMKPGDELPPPTPPPGSATTPSHGGSTSSKEEEVPTPDASGTQDATPEASQEAAVDAPPAHNPEATRTDAHDSAATVAVDAAVTSVPLVTAKADVATADVRSASVAGSAADTAAEQAVAAERRRVRAVWQGKLEEIYRTHNPSKIPEVPALLDQFAGHEVDLYDAVLQKYVLSATPQGTTAAPTTTTSSSAARPRIQTPAAHQVLLSPPAEPTPPQGIGHIAHADGAASVQSLRYLSPASEMGQPLQSRAGVPGPRANGTITSPPAHIPQSPSVRSASYQEPPPSRTLSPEPAGSAAGYTPASGASPMNAPVWTTSDGSGGLHPRSASDMSSLRGHALPAAEVPLPPQTAQFRSRSAQERGPPPPGAHARGGYHHPHQHHPPPSRPLAAKRSGTASPHGVRSLADDDDDDDETSAELRKVLAALHSHLWTGARTSIPTAHLIHALLDQNFPSLVAPLVSLLDPRSTGAIPLSRWTKLLHAPPPRSRSRPQPPHMPGRHRTPSPHAASVRSASSSRRPSAPPSPSPTAPQPPLRRSLPDWYEVKTPSGNVFLKNRKTGERILKSRMEEVGGGGARGGDVGRSTFRRRAGNTPVAVEESPQEVRRGGFARQALGVRAGQRSRSRDDVPAFGLPGACLPRYASGVAAGAVRSRSANRETPGGGSPMSVVQASPAARQPVVAQVPLPHQMRRRAPVAHVDPHPHHRHRSLTPADGAGGGVVVATPQPHHPHEGLAHTPPTADTVDPRDAHASAASPAPYVPVPPPADASGGGIDEPVDGIASDEKDSVDHQQETILEAILRRETTERERVLEMVMDQQRTNNADMLRVLKGEYEEEKQRTRMQHEAELLALKNEVQNLLVRDRQRDNDLRREHTERELQIDRLRSQHDQLQHKLETATHNPPPAVPPVPTPPAPDRSAVELYHMIRPHLNPTGGHTPHPLPVQASPADSSASLRVDSDLLDRLQQLAARDAAAQTHTLLGAPAAQQPVDVDRPAAAVRAPSPLASAASASVSISASPRSPQHVRGAPPPPPAVPVVALPTPAPLLVPPSEPLAYDTVSLKATSVASSPRSRAVRPPPPPPAQSQRAASPAYMDSPTSVAPSLLQQLAAQSPEARQGAAAAGDGSPHANQQSYGDLDGLEEELMSLVSDIKKLSADRPVAARVAAPRAAATAAVQPRAPPPVRRAYSPAAAETQAPRPAVDDPPPQAPSTVLNVHKVQQAPHYDPHAVNRRPTPQRRLPPPPPL